MGMGTQDEDDRGMGTRLLNGWPFIILTLNHDCIYKHDNKMKSWGNFYGVNFRHVSNGFH